MEPEFYRKEMATEIRKRVIELRGSGKKTSKGEAMSLAAIGRTLEPPVTRQALYLVIDGKSESRRIKRAIEQELQKPFWILRKVA